VKRFLSSPSRRRAHSAAASGVLLAMITLVCMSYVVIPPHSPSGTVSAGAAKGGRQA
jgi:hypothetical protein